jgi:hypothetical protein
MKVASWVHLAHSSSSMGPKLPQASIMTPEKPFMESWRT